MIFWSFCNSHTLLSQIFSGDVRKLLTESKKSFHWKLAPKGLLDVKIFFEKLDF